MSDYTITHGHLLDERDRIQVEAEFEDWIDSCSQEPEALPVPTCGMCVSFVPDRRFKTVDGKEFVSPSHCKARALADLPPFYKASDSAENCPFFDYDCPF
jgi:hypothetical protein